MSRQIRDLEDEVGAQLLTRSPRGIELTPAGRAFLDHARLVLSQVEAAADADLVLGYKKSNKSPILRAFAFEIGRDWSLVFRKGKRSEGSR